jgi:DNA-3-methyladenine glycosylase I
MEKKKPKSYCEYVGWLEKDSPHQGYHDSEYGFPITDDDQLFQRLVLEINQAGLNWTTILNKKENFVKAYSGFQVAVVAGYGEKDIARLLSDAGIIRNKLKVGAAIHNARMIVGLQKEHGSFKAWLDTNHPLTREQWVTLFKKTFKFTGGEITNEFLLSSGYLKGSHEEGCKTYKEILKLKPMWLEG